MPRRSLVIPVATMALLVAGCSSPHDPKTDPPPTRSAASKTASTTAATTATTTAGTTPTPGTVPVDQIPPGRPATWIPAGMPTVAPWKEPGDVLPRFTLAMFEHTPAGALAAASFYVNARNWALATLSSMPYLLLCESQRCKDNAKAIDAVAAAHGRVVGARERSSHRTLVPAGAAGPAEWIVRLDLSLQAGGVVDARGAMQRPQRASTEVNDLYMRWNGSRWLVHEDALGR